MCGLKAAQIHERPFRAAKEPVQPLAALDSFFALRQKDLISSWFIIHGWHSAARAHQIYK